MIKRMIMQLSVVLLLTLGQSAIAGTNGLLFNVSATGASANVSIMLCLNGKGPVSCQNYNVSALTLSISTTVLNHVYPFAGIKINTPGYTLDDSGLDCIPNDNGYCLFSVSNMQAKTISLVVNGSLFITPTSLPAAILNTCYHQMVTASGGVAPYTYVIMSGLLPAGLSLNPSTGLIFGRPTTLGTYSFTVAATDAIFNTGSQGYSLTVITTGSSYQGGTVACLTSEGGNANLIAATNDNSAVLQWGGLGTSIPAAESDDDGAANTTAIVSALGEGTDYAAGLCANYEIDSSGHSPCLEGYTCYNEWFLPAKNQLNCLYTNQTAVGGFFLDTPYWSSTEDSSNSSNSLVFAWDQYFSGGGQFVDGKDQVTHFRCVRGFIP